MAGLPLTVRESLYFDYSSLVAGNWIGGVSGHWIHVDTEHLIWNVGALAILSSLIEVHSRGLLLWSILVGVASVDLLLVSPLSDVARYCGLSGALNTLLGVALFLLWKPTRSRLVLLIGALCLLKIAIEIVLGDSLFTEIGWPPYAPAHLAGIIATPIALLLGYRDTITKKNTGEL